MIEFDSLNLTTITLQEDLKLKLSENDNCSLILFGRINAIIKSMHGRLPALGRSPTGSLRRETQADECPALLRMKGALFSATFTGCSPLQNRRVTSLASCGAVE
ncbi:MAG: hypothetical protein ACRCXD_18215 [Luteolibacter sp.]